MVTTTAATIAQLLGTMATAYGVLAALSVLLQARQMLARRASCEVSGRFFATYVGGYAIWLLYGLSVGNMPLIIVDAVGLLCGGLTLAVTLSLRGSLIHPTSWTSCTPIQVSEVSSERVATAIPNTDLAWPRPMQTATAEAPPRARQRQDGTARCAPQPTPSACRGMLPTFRYGPKSARYLPAKRRSTCDW